MNMIFGKNIEVRNDGNSVLVEFDGCIANVTINGNDKLITTYNENLNVEEAAKKLTKALIKESKPSIYSELFPAFGREFKILVSNILKARV